MGMAASPLAVVLVLGILAPAAGESPGLLLAAALGQPAHRAIPDHPALTERFDFIELLHHSRRDHAEASPERRLLENLITPEGLAAFTSPISLIASMAGMKDVPRELPRSMGRFEESKFLGQGSFGAAYKARDSTTGKVVVVKMLVLGNTWLTPQLARRTIDAMKWVNESIDECVKIKEIHKNGGVYPDGAPHLLMCLEDGIQETMKDSQKQTDPLYIVLNYAGDSYSVWWKLVLTRQTEQEASSALRSLTRDLMKGLAALTHKDATTKWIHHDLKPDNLAVSGEWSKPSLSLIDMGGAVPDSQPETKAVCTPVFRPLDQSHPTRTKIGWKKPVHSFDMASAGLVLVSSALAHVGGAIPMWYVEITARSTVEFFNLKNLKGVADCMAKDKTEDTRAFATGYEDCWDKEGVNKLASQRFAELVGKIGEGNSETDRMKAFSPMLCGGITGEHYDPEKPNTAGRIVHEWVTSGFDKTLARMLDVDPAKRPTPEEVLAMSWLATDYESPAGDGKVIPSTPCQEQTIYQLGEEHTKWHIYFPMGIAAAVSIFSCCCGCCGCLCHAFAQTPSAGFTAIVIGYSAIGAAAASGVWLASFTQTVLIVSSLVLGPAIVVLGCNSVRNRDVSDSAKTAWTIGLFAAGAYFLMLFVAIYWLSANTKWMLYYISENYFQIQKASEEDDIQSIVFMPQSVYALLANLINLTLAPAGVGLVAVAFGLWREDYHRRLDRQAPARRVTGTEMMSSRQSAAAGP